MSQVGVIKHAQSVHPESLSWEVSFTALNATYQELQFLGSEFALAIALFCRLLIDYALLLIEFCVCRFKVNLQVMDDTGSITFIMFDRVVAQFIGRTAHDLLDAANRVFPHFLCVLSSYIVYHYLYIFFLLIIFIGS
jgi:hypothetical protein